MTRQNESHEELEKRYREKLVIQRRQCRESMVYSRTKTKGRKQLRDSERPQWIKILTLSLRKKTVISTSEDTG